MGTEDRSGGVDAKPLEYAPYRNKYAQMQARGLDAPGLILPDDVHVSFLGNNTLLPQAFDLRDPDTWPLGGCPYPGKSASVAFTANPDLAYRAQLGRNPRRTDHLYTISAGDLLTVGYVAVTAPLPGKPLHVRLVHAVHTNGTPRAMIPHQSQQLLAALMQRHKVR